MADHPGGDEGQELTREGKVELLQALSGNQASANRCRQLLDDHDGDIEAAAASLLEGEGSQPPQREEGPARGSQSQERPWQSRPPSGHNRHQRRGGPLGFLAGAVTRVTSIFQGLLSMLFGAMGRIFALIGIGPALREAGEGRGEAAGAEFAREIERRNGPGAPAFRRGTHREALREASRSNKLLAVVLVDNGQASERLISETLTATGPRSALQASYVAWGATSTRTEARRLAEALAAPEWPTVAILKPAGEQADLVRQESGDSAGNPERVAKALREAASEYGVETEHSQSRDHAERARLLREEQDREYQEALKQDRAKQERDERARREHQALESRRHEAKLRLEKRQEPSEAVRIAIRLPSGSRLQERFGLTERVDSIYDLADSCAENDIPRYALVSSHGREELPARNSGATLSSAGLTKPSVLVVERRDAEPPSPQPSSSGL